MSPPKGNGNEPLPPTDVEAEEAVVASLLVDPDAISKVAPILEPGDFYREKNGWAYESALACWERNESINQITVGHDLAGRGRLEEVGGVAYLSGLIAELPTSVGVEHYAALVRETSTRRALVTHAQLLVRAAHADNDVVGVLDRAEAGLAGLRSRSPVAAAVDIGTSTEPAPLEDLVEGLEKVGSISGFYGTEGVAKTLLAIYRDTCLTAGLPFLGRATRRIPALFVDFELYEVEFTRKAWQVARGAGLERPPEGLHYMAADRPLLEMMPAIKAAIRRTGAQSVTIDSLSMAGVVDQDSALAARRELALLGISVCCIDHQARAQKFESYDSKAPYGSRFKEAMLASLWQIELAEVQPAGGIDLLLRDKKYRHGPHRADMGVRIAFASDRVTFATIDPAASIGLEEKLGGMERVEAALQRLGDVTAKEITKDVTGLSVATVTTYLSRLKKLGRAEDFPGQTSRDPHLWRQSTQSKRVETTPTPRVDGPYGPISTTSTRESASTPSKRSTRNQGEQSKRAEDTCHLCDLPAEGYTAAGRPAQIWPPAATFVLPAEATTPLLRDCQERIK